MYIYKTTNLINSKIYIGQHRAIKFNKNYYGSGKILHKALQKYGTENFKVEMICEAFSIDHLNLLEIYFIAQYRNLHGRNKLYNITDGGGGGNGGKGPGLKGKRNGMYDYYTKWVKKYGIEEADRRNLKRSEKISKNLKGKPGTNTGLKRSQETKDKLRKLFLGKKLTLTEEQRKNRSEKRKGKNNPMYGKSIYSIWIKKYGKEIADEKLKSFKTKKSIQTSGSKNAMHNNSFYKKWVERYGEEIANKKQEETKIKRKTTWKEKKNRIL
jgi:hypothetical protein